MRDTDKIIFANLNNAPKRFDTLSLLVMSMQEVVKLVMPMLVI
ncbi:hypothetical protein GMES_3890 [Paraglaciecola mesophila KMM 241]|uniref:Uncharacterized protein n=1 Tax=Paraglaciecola mesophila KMM 241 TaxID=1128912 RepID=K6ZB07_9ALTE|nr:hypothetical protein GMES_3890 [Paraglaciecola mesophila KMM 241]